MRTISEVIDDLKETLLEKNKKYGAAYLEPPVLTPHLAPGVTLLVRMSDKISRLQSLALDACYHDQTGEAFEDTLKDLAGYCILYLTMVPNDKTLRK